MPSTTSGAPVPYRRRKSVQALPVSHAADPLESLPGKTPASGLGAPLFYELPPIVITDVRYVISESSEAEPNHRQEQFEYLSSEEDPDSGDEEEGRSLMSVLRSHRGDFSSKTQGEKEWGSKLELECKRSPMEEKRGPMEEEHKCMPKEPVTESTQPSLAAASVDERYAFRPTNPGFRERFLAMKKQEFAEDFWPEYHRDVDMAGLEARAQAALAVVVDSCVCSRVPAAAGGCGLRERLVVDRFLANFFMDPEVFEADEDLRRRMVAGRYLPCACLLIAYASCS